MKRKTTKKTNSKVLRFERKLAHPPERVWRALTEKTQLDAWFPANVDTSLKDGAPVRFSERKDDAPRERGVVREFAPPSRLEYTWGDRVLRWEISPAPGGSLLVLTTTSVSTSVSTSRTLALAA